MIFNIQSYHWNYRLTWLDIFPLSSFIIGLGMDIRLLSKETFNWRRYTGLFMQWICIWAKCIPVYEVPFYYKNIQPRIFSSSFSLLLSCYLFFFSRSSKEVTSRLFEKPIHRDVDAAASEYNNETLGFVERLEYSNNFTSLSSLL